MAFHPPGEEHAHEHVDEPPTKKMSCASANGYDLLADFVGECYHEDHHTHPCKFLRPGSDLPYWWLLRPMVKLGLCNTKRNTQKFE